MLGSDFKLERFLRDSGWTDSDLMTLRTPDMAASVLRDIRSSHAHSTACALVDALERHKQAQLTEIFTEELTRSLGYAISSRTRFLNAMRHFEVMSLNLPIKTIGQLHSIGKKGLLNTRNISSGTLGYVTAVLRTLGIAFNDF